MKRPCAIEAVDGVGHAGEQVAATRPAPVVVRLHRARSPSAAGRARRCEDYGTRTGPCIADGSGPNTPESSRLGAGQTVATEARSTISLTPAPAGQRAEHGAPVAAQAGGAEGVGDRRRRVPQEQRALQAQRQQPGDPPGPQGQLVGVAELGVQPLHRVVEPGVGAAGELDLGADGGQRVRRAAHRPQHVERDDVARALPDRVQRRLAVEPGQPRLLDVAVAAEHLHRLGDRRRACACTPRTSPPRRPAAGSADSPASRAAASRTASAVAASLSTRQVGQHVLHQRLVDQQGAERPPVPGVVDRLGERRAHRGRRAQHAVQPGGVDHLDDRRDPAARLAHQPARRPVELHLAGGVGPVAELVLEPLHAEHVAAAVGQHPRDEEAGHALVELRQHQEQVAHRGRGEPLVPGQPVAAVGLGDGAGGVRPDVGAALLLGHPHAGDQPALAGGLGQAELVLPVAVRPGS